MGKRVWVPKAVTMLLEMGSAPATSAADDALVVGFCIWINALFGSSLRERFGARARRTTAEAAALPMKTNCIIPHNAELQTKWHVCVGVASGCSRGAGASTCLKNDLSTAVK